MTKDDKPMFSRRCSKCGEECTAYWDFQVKFWKKPLLLSLCCWASVTVESGKD